MEKNKSSEGKGRIKKMAILSGAIVISLIIALIAWPRVSDGSEKVDFQEVEENKLPTSITSDVIPEYKTLERALACIVDDDVYVLVTRGEKPSSGFGISIDRLVLETEDDRTNLIVYAEFDDPDKETPVSQIITYPLSVVKTDLTKLPDAIELRIQY